MEEITTALTTLGLCWVATGGAWGSSSKRGNPALKPSDMVSPFVPEAQLRCGSAYENHRFICDPANFVSLTELTTIRELLKGKGFCSCPVIYNKADAQVLPRKWPLLKEQNALKTKAAPTVAIAIMGNAYLPEDIFSKDLTVNEDIAGGVYAALLRHDWSTDVCPIDILFLWLRWSSRSSNDTMEHLYTSFGDRLRKFGFFFNRSVRRYYTVMYRDKKEGFTQQMRYMLHFMPTNVSSTERDWRAALRVQFDGSVMDLPPTGRDEIATVDQWPTWSVIVFGSCVVLILLSLVIGNCIDKTHRQAYFTRGLMNRQSNRRWGAGFAGGMMTKNQQGGGGGGGGKMGNTMMFRQFNRSQKTNTSNYV